MKTNTFDSERRNFFKYTFFAAAGVLLIPFFKKEAGLVFAADLPLLTAADPTGAALGYYADANKDDVKKWPGKAVPHGKNQKCSSCAQYTVIDKNKGKCN